MSQTFHGARVALVALLAIVNTHPVTAQGRGAQRDTVLVARRDSLEKALEAVAVIDRKRMVAMRDGTRIPFDVYRPKNASGKVPAIFVRTPYNMNFWDVSARRAGRHDAAARRREARLRVGRRERARPLLLRRQLRHPRPAAHRRRRRDQLDQHASVVERQGRSHRLLVDGRMADGRRRAGTEGARHDHSAGIRRGRGSRRSVLRAGQLVSRRRGTNALHRLVDGRAESGAPNVAEERDAAGSHSRREVVRSRAASAAGRLGEELLASAGEGSHQEPSTARTASSPIRCPASPRAAR